MASGPRSERGRVAVVVCREEARWWLVSVPARVVTLIVAFLAVVAGVAFVVVHYLLAGPPIGGLHRWRHARTPVRRSTW